MCGPGNLLGVTWPLSCCSVSPNHVLVDSLCSVRVFKLFSRSIHYSYVMLINHGRSPRPIRMMRMMKMMMMIMTFNIAMMTFLLLVIRCPPLFVLDADPPTGICSNPELSYHSYCSFKCRFGYRQKGSEVRVCQLNKTWSGTSTTCEGTQRITLP